MIIAKYINIHDLYSLCKTQKHIFNEFDKKFPKWMMQFRKYNDKFINGYCPGLLHALDYTDTDLNEFNIELNDFVKRCSVNNFKWICLESNFAILPHDLLVLYDYYPYAKNQNAIHKKILIFKQLDVTLIDYDRKYISNIADMVGTYKPEAILQTLKYLSESKYCSNRKIYKELRRFKKDPKYPRIIIEWIIELRSKIKNA